MKRLIEAIFILLLLIGTTSHAKAPSGYAFVEVYPPAPTPLAYAKEGLFQKSDIRLFLFDSHDMNLTADTIEEYDRLFRPIKEAKSLLHSPKGLWLKVDLGEKFPSGRFVYRYGDADFSLHTISPSQHPQKFVVEGRQYLSFTYTKGVDPTIYYFKLEPKAFHTPYLMLSVTTLKTLIHHLTYETDQRFLMGLLLGVILMAAIYNASLFYYNKEQIYLYYALMQTFVLLTLYHYSDAYFYDAGSLLARNFTYESIISLFAALFGVLFTQKLLETRRHFPTLHQISVLIGWIIVADMVSSLLYHSLIITHILLPMLMLPLLYMGYRRALKGDRPAQYYVAGWLLLGLSILFNDNAAIRSILPVQSLYIGAAAEALLFSMALSYRLHLINMEKKRQEKILVQQSKLSALGELLGNIAHQWRQPLTHLGYLLMNLKEAQKHQELDETYLNDKLDAATKQLTHLSQTIDDFQRFYAPTKKKEWFSLDKMAQETLEIIDHAIKTEGISLTYVLKKDQKIYTYKNEIKQVLLNLLQNAYEALRHNKNAPEREITLTIDTHTITIEDNAGGVKEKVIERIFDPYFSTKEGGIGIGLYMSKMIVERHIGGSITATNTVQGARFTITLPNSDRIDTIEAP